MKTLKEPTAEEIKKKRIYAEWGLTDEEYRTPQEHTFRPTPTSSELDCFLLCGANIVPIKILNRFYANFLLVDLMCCKALEKAQASSTSVMD